MLTRTHVSAAFSPALLLGLVVSPACRARVEAPLASDAPVEVKPTPAEPIRAEVEPSTPPAAGAPKTCTLLVRLFEASGRPRIDNGTVEIDSGLSAPLIAGIARFENVPVGSLLQVWITGPGLAAPLVCGGTISKSAGAEHVFDFSASWGTWAGVRIIDHDGQPAALRTLDYWVRDVREPRHADQFGPFMSILDLKKDVTTRADGMLWFPWSSLRPRQNGTAVTHLVRFDDRESVALDLDHDFPKGETLLPDVHLRFAPDLVAGRVLRADRTPSWGFRVWVEHRADANSEWALLPGFEVFNWWWDEGKFRITGKAPAGELRVGVRQGKPDRVYLPFTPGQRDVEFAFDP